MNILMEVLQFIGAATGAATGSHGVYTLVATYLAKWKTKPPKNILTMLTDLGCRTDREVRQLIEDWKPAKPLPAAAREELTELLINLMHGARLHTTKGSLTGKAVHFAEVIDILIDHMQTCRRRGEMVGPGWGGWELVKFLGKGACGEVWLGKNQKMTKRLAFKFFTQVEDRNLLINELQTLNEVSTKLGKHPNIIELDNVVTDESHQYPFLALEYVGGGSLEEWILSKPDDRPALNKHAIIGGIVRGLSQAHEKNIYHGDLKPANILLTEGKDVQPKIADFGLGRMAEEATPAATETVPAALMGTNMYLPPEALKPFAMPHPGQYDVFALGVLWFQLLVGKLERPPYDFAEELRQAGQDTRTVKLISRCLAHPARRYKSAVELAEEITDSEWPVWDPVPEGFFDVQYLVQEFGNAT